jgi:solute carrier family 50 protein (sugar transporter)
MIIEAIGLVMASGYSIFYLHYVSLKKKLIKQLIFLIVCFIIIYSYCFHYEKDNEKSTFYIGLLASVLSIIMFGSPLASLRHVFKTKSTESLSFLLCLANFIVATEWYIYGLLIKDYFVQVY